MDPCTVLLARLVVRLDLIGFTPLELVLTFMAGRHDCIVEIFRNFPGKGVVRTL